MYNLIFVLRDIFHERNRRILSLIMLRNAVLQIKSYLSFTEIGTLTGVKTIKQVKEEN